MSIRFASLISFALVVALSGPASGAIFGWGKAKPSAASPTAAQQRPLSLAEFTALAIELAPKVNLFKAVWAQNPGAEFFGGTTRDYLYWLKGKLHDSHTRAAVIADLRSRKTIDVREFVAPGSDVDVVAKRDSVVIDVSPYAVKRIDFVNIARFNPTHPVGETEVKQGFIPIEKIRLSKASVYTDTQFGDGVREIFESHPTVHFASDRDFNESYYAKLGINHPILLALRYIRVVSLDYRKNHGDAIPTLHALLATMDKPSHDAVMRVIHKAADGHELVPYLANEKFMEWLEAALKKTNSGHTSIEASSLLLDHFGARELAVKYPSIAPLMPARAPVRSCEALMAASI